MKQGFNSSLNPKMVSITVCLKSNKYSFCSLKSNSSFKTLKLWNLKDILQYRNEIASIAVFELLQKGKQVSGGKLDSDQNQNSCQQKELFWKNMRLTKYYLFYHKQLY